MMTEYIGYLGGILMGISLGLMGGGGSILTVPILVYLFALNPLVATTYSLFIVGLTSAIGSVSHMRMGNVRWQTALAFGIPSIVSVLITRAMILPALPDPIFNLGAFTVSKPLFVLLLFSLLMIAASVSMIRRRTKEQSSSTTSAQNILILSAEGLAVGFLTALVGAGGGFLIIPSLVFFAGLTMKQAVGTSLTIIASNTLIGFLGSLRSDTVIDWKFLVMFSGLAVAGILIGSALSKKVSNEKLKPAFGWFILAMGVYIIARETIFN